MEKHYIEICGLAETNCDWEFKDTKEELTNKARNAFNNSVINFSKKINLDQNTKQATNQKDVSTLALITGQVASIDVPREMSTTDLLSPNM
jgi:methionyl-tRNA formyltransferase